MFPAEAMIIIDMASNDFPFYVASIFGNFWFKQVSNPP